MFANLRTRVIRHGHRGPPQRSSRTPGTASTVLGTPGTSSTVLTDTRDRLNGPHGHQRPPQRSSAASCSVTTVTTPLRLIVRSKARSHSARYAVRFRTLPYGTAVPRVSKLVEHVKKYCRRIPQTAIRRNRTCVERTVAVRSSPCGAVLRFHTVPAYITGSGHWHADACVRYALPIRKRPQGCAVPYGAVPHHAVIGVADTYILHITFYFSYC